MRSMPIELEENFALDSHATAHLVEFNLKAGVYRFTDFNKNLYYAGQWYYSRGLKFEDAQYSLLPRIDNLSLEADDVDGYMTNLLRGVDEVRNQGFTLYKCALDNNLGPIGTVTMFTGYIDRIRGGDGHSVKLDIYNHMIRWKMQTPRRQHEPACRWTFKDPDTCRYAGAETWCDFSHARCEALGNDINFPGDRWLTDLQTRQLWWGRVQQ